jgi:predicted HicB family RNase H-like nuclease
MSLSYKGFQGEVTGTGGRFLIRILDIDDLITTECNSSAEVEGAFHALVDDYLDTCRRLGREPARRSRCGVAAQPSDGEVS